MRFLFVIFLFAMSSPALASDRPRLLVLTDIGGDPDDQQSMVRLMLYTNEFEIEGLIATAAGVPGELPQKITRPELIREIVEAYGQVQPNLLLHDERYPPVAGLRARIKTGNANRGRQAIGEGHDTEASRWIIQAADKQDDRPLNISIWGGQTDFAQALWRMRHDRSADVLARFLKRIRVYDIADQDGLVAWIHENFPELFYVRCQSREREDKREAAFRGMYLDGDASLTSRAWLDEHVRRNHGPLGRLYPNAGWTDPNPHRGLKEGDTPSWFYFLPNGLGDAAHPEWGGWGGRFAPTESNKNIFRDAEDTVNEKTHRRATVWRWRPAFQSDFQARMDWCVKPFDQANHAPVAILNGDTSRRPVHISAKPGDTVTLSTQNSRDSDGDKLHYRWYLYSEAGTYRGDFQLDPKSTASDTLRFTAPTVAASATLHIILEVRDAGEPSLTSYRRAVIEIRP